MRITINVAAVTPAQWDWLLTNVRQDWKFAAGDVRMCVTFEDPEGLGHAHREIEIGEWVRIIGELTALTRTAEAVLTPDALPDVWPPYGN